MQKIRTFLTFNDQAEEAARFYTSIFRDSSIVNTTRGPDGGVLVVEFRLGGQDFIALNGGPTLDGEDQRPRPPEGQAGDGHLEAER